MILKNKNIAFNYKLALYVFVFGSLISSFLLYFYYKNQKEEALQSSSKQLYNVTNFKTGLLSNWLENNLGESINYFSSNSFSQKIDSIYNYPNSSSKQELQNILKKISDKESIESVIIYDANGSQILTNQLVKDDTNCLSIADVQSLDTKLRDGKIDLNICEKNDSVYYTLIIPSYILDKGQKKLHCVTALNTNPFSSLFPILNHWPGNASSLESYIVEISDNEIQYVSNITNLNSSIFGNPISSKSNGFDTDSLLTNNAILGFDYRGNEVYASAQNIWRLNSYLISQINETEINSIASSKAGNFAIIILLILLSILILIYFLLRNTRSVFYKKLYRAEKERSAIKQNYKEIFDGANDIILLVNGKNEIVEANAKALSSFNYAMDEMIGLNYRALIPVGLKTKSENIFSVLDDNGVLIDLIYLRNDSTIFFAEASFKKIVLSGTTLTQIIIRDTTDKINSLQQIKNLNQSLQLISKCNRALVKAKTEEELISNICEYIVEIGEYNFAWVGFLQGSTLSSVHSHGQCKQIEWKLKFLVTKMNTPEVKAINYSSTYISIDNSNSQFSSSWNNMMVECGLYSTIAFPIIVKNIVIGVLSISSKEKKRFSSKREVDILEELSSDLSYGISYIRESKAKLETEQLLQASEKKYRSLFEEDLTGDVISTPDGTILQANDAAAKIFGYTSSEHIIDLNINNFYSDKAERSRLIETLTKKGKVENHETAISNNLGYKIYVVQNTSGRFNGEGELIEVVDYLFDITSRKKAELANIESERFAVSTINSLSSSIAIIDHHGIIITANKTWKENVQSNTSCLIKGVEGINYLSLCETVALNNDSEANKLIDAVKQIRENTLSRFEFEFECASGNSERWFLITLTRFISNNYVVVSHEDITNRKLAEEQIKKLSRALEQSPISVIICDVDGNITYVNKKFSDMTGYSLDEVINKKTSVFANEKFTSDIVDKIKKTIASGENWAGEYQSQNKAGDNYWAHTLISGVFNKNKKLTNLIIIKEDISKQKAVNEELVAAKEIAEKSNRLKTEFLAQMSHEIRTPLNAILTFANLLTEEFQDKASEELKDGFDGMRRASNRIIRTIDLILNLSELQTGLYEPIMEEIDLIDRVIDNLQMEFYPRIKEKNLDFSIQNQTSFSRIIADEFSIKQIFSNIIDNAIKYTKSGGIYISLFNNEGDKLCVSIRDTGIGISEKYLEQLFVPFTQEEQGYTRSYDGNGLGLALVKKYCELNNASIDVSSKKYRGTTITLTFGSLN